MLSLLTDGMTSTCEGNCTIYYEPQKLDFTHPIMLSIYAIMIIAIILGFVFNKELQLKSKKMGGKENE